MTDQELRRDIGRAIKVAFGDDPQDLPTPDGVSLIGWSADGKLIDRPTEDMSAALERKWALIAAAFAGLTSGAGFATRNQLKASLALSHFECNFYVTVEGEVIMLLLDGGPLAHLDDGQIVFAAGLGTSTRRLRR